MFEGLLIKHASMCFKSESKTSHSNTLSRQAQQKESSYMLLLHVCHCTKSFSNTIMSMALIGIKSCTCTLIVLHIIIMETIIYFIGLCLRFARELFV